MGIPVPERTLDGPGVSVLEKHWRTGKESNLQPADLEAAALPIELEVYLIWWAIKVTILAGPFGHGGYSPGSLLRSLITRWWKRRVLNPIPKFAKLRCYPVNTPPPFVTVILHHTVTALVACLFLWLKAT